MNSDYQVLYPKLYSTIKNLYELALKKQSSLDALKTYGHFPNTAAGNAALFNMLQFGRGAEIVVKNINLPPYNGPHRYGYFDPKNPSQIFLDINFIKDLERSPDPLAENALQFFLFVTVMHETVHYANHVNGFFEKNHEWGGGWETVVYGQHIDSPQEAWNFLLKKNY